MSHIIELLEASGRGDAAMHHGASVLGGFSPEQRDAITTGDAAAVARLFGIPAVRACYVSAPDNDPVPADSPADVPDDLPDEPDQQGSEAA